LFDRALTVSKVKSDIEPADDGEEERRRSTAIALFKYE
jgi:hypothetical protein